MNNADLYLIAGAAAYVALNTSEVDYAQDFINGFVAAGGDPGLANYFAYTVAPCESTSNPFVISPTGYLGFIQWSPVTWSVIAGRTGYFDWQSPWQQGFNAVILMQEATPESQWSCYGHYP